LQIKSLNQTVFRLQEELQLVMEKQDVTSNLTSWHESYTEQLTILASAMEVNAKLRTDLSMALRELDDLKASLAVSSKSSEALTGRVRDLEQVNIRLNEESRTLKEQLENWNSRFGVNQQKDEIEGLKKKIIDLEKQLQEQSRFQNACSFQFISFSISFI
jgi:chromosome segregation ATPase